MKVGVVFEADLFADLAILAFLFGRRPNGVMETACFDANVQQVRNKC